MRPRRRPLRSCLGCGAERPKPELLRLVRNMAGDLVVDRTGKQPGRGAYLCREGKCWQKALKPKLLERAFRRPVTPEEIAALAAAIATIVDAAARAASPPEEP